MRNWWAQSFFRVHTPARQQQSQTSGYLSAQGCCTEQISNRLAGRLQSWPENTERATVMVEMQIAPYRAWAALKGYGPGSRAEGKEVRLGERRAH